MHEKKQEMAKLLEEREKQKIKNKQLALEQSLQEEKINTIKKVFLDKLVEIKKKQLELSIDVIFRKFFFTFFR